MSCHVFFQERNEKDKSLKRLRYPEAVNGGVLKKYAKLWHTNDDECPLDGRFFLKKFVPSSEKRTVILAKPLKITMEECNPARMQTRSCSYWNNWIT